MQKDFDLGSLLSKEWGVAKICPKQTIFTKKKLQKDLNLAIHFYVLETTVANDIKKINKSKQPIEVKVKKFIFMQFCVDRHPTKTIYYLLMNYDFNELDLS
ncbi:MULTISPECIES: hypothetical protein [Holospora]|uniref:hypothetical protein n=1 Tax=Holospora TaxID=44747 RepID=UPI0012686BE9|nr:MULTISPECIES: hypothetical protein [Holospora]